MEGLDRVPWDALPYVPFLIELACNQQAAESPCRWTFSFGNRKIGSGRLAMATLITFIWWIAACHYWRKARREGHAILV